MTYLHSAIFAHGKTEDWALAENLYVGLGFQMLLESPGQGFHAILEGKGGSVLEFVMQIPDIRPRL